MITIEVKRDVKATREQLLILLLEHQNLGLFFNAKVSVVRQHDAGEIDGGTGTIRKIAIGFISFNEQIMVADINHIQYCIVGKSPVKEHQGDIYLSLISEQHERTLVHYVIKFKGPFWLPDFILKKVVQNDIEKAMEKIALSFNSA